MAEKPGFFKRLFNGLSKTRTHITNAFDRIFSRFSRLDEDFYEELEEVLITSDMGVRTTENILDTLRERVRDEHIKDPSICRQILIDSIRNQMAAGNADYDFEEKTSVLLLIGVNGAGKTTTIGKLASQFKAAGKKVMIAAADTFRAAAGDQLDVWAERAGVPAIGGQAGADPASVVYDAVQSAKSKKADILLCDTAGRLHNKKNLMAELGKIYRTIAKEYSEAFVETLVVLDATTGQNAYVQAREFSEVAPVSGIILTKMDGTAKGGIAVAIQSELGLPVKYIGVGEGIDDLQKFDPDSYVDAIFDLPPA